MSLLVISTEDKSDQLAVLGPNLRSASAILDIGEERDRHLISRRRGNQHPLQLIDIVAESRA